MKNEFQLSRLPLTGSMCTGKRAIAAFCALFFIAASVFFTACPVGGKKSDPDNNKTTQQLHDDLALLLGDAGTLFDAIGNTIVISADGRGLSGKQWVPQPDADALQAAITAATAIFDDTGSSREALEQAVSDLTAAIAAFNAAVQTAAPKTFAELWAEFVDLYEEAGPLVGDAGPGGTIVIGTNAADVTLDKTWVTQEVFDALNNAFNAADQLYNTVDNPDDPDNETNYRDSLDEAVSDLVAAINAFNPQPGTKKLPFKNYAPTYSTVTPTGAANAVDGKSDTAIWTSGSLSGKTIELEFATAVTLNWGVIREKNSMGPTGTITGFKVEYWDADTVAWVTAFTETNPSPIPASTTGATPYPFGFTSVITTTKVKLTINAATGNTSGFFEFELYNTPDRAAIRQAIADAETALTASPPISALNGSDVLIGTDWVTQAAKDTYSTAIAAARVIATKLDVDEAEPTAAQLAGAVATLTAASVAFSAAQQPGTKTPAPTTNSPSAGKTASTQASVDFTLTGSYEAGAAWSVHNTAGSTAPLAGVSASLSGLLLTLTASGGDLDADTYFVRVTNAGKSISDPLELTVTAYFNPATQTPVPQLSSSAAAKETVIQQSVDFTLTGTYDGTETWKIYETASGGSVSTTVTVSCVSPFTTLTLTSTGADLAAKSYYLTVEDVTNGKNESPRLTLSVQEYTRVVRASIAHATPDTVQVEFNLPVSAIDTTKFVVKVNDMPTYKYDTLTGNDKALLDLDMTTRRVTAAAATGDNKIWDLTMSVPAQYGEIIRLATDATGGAVNTGVTYQLPLPVVPQLIVQNGVKRYSTKPAFEAQAGFYKDGVILIGVTGETYDTAPGSSVAADAVYESAKAYLSTAAAHGTSGAVYTIVVDTNQTFARTWGQPFDIIGSTVPTWASSKYKCTIVVTTITGNTTNFNFTSAASSTGSDGFILKVARGTTFVIDEYVVFDGSAKSDNGDSYIGVYEGGKLILDGGTIKGGKTKGFVTQAVAAGVRLDPANGYGAYAIINSGSITSNAVSSSSSGAAECNPGGVALGSYSTLIMHGGSITSNSTAANGTFPKAGGISSQIRVNQHGTDAFYMTGGSITGNTQSGTGGYAKAGGILTGGVFQKTGGIISGNTVAGSGGTVRVQGIAVLKVLSNNPALTDAFIFAGASNANDTLFVEAIKPSHGASNATLTVPNWAPSYWD